MRFLLVFLLISSYAYSNEVDFYKIKLPFKTSQVQAIYQLDNGNIIYIQRYERGDRIWEKKEDSNELKEISYLFSFIALARECESLNERDIYFGQNREYWLGGGAKIDYAQIRVFDLYDPNPWRDSDLGIVPDMKHVKYICNFYEPLFYSDW